MRLELVTIGTELLLGLTVDGNAAVLGQTLAEAGIHVVRKTTVGDETEAIEAAVRDALGRTGTVITTGGLGPTADDVTRDAVARVMDTALRFDQEIWDQLVARFRAMGREPSTANRVQALVPEGATVLPNRWGTAPGLWLEGTRGLAVLLPGVPREMGKLLRHEVLPRLTTRETGRAIRSLVVRTTSIPESSLQERLSDAGEWLTPLSLAFLPGIEGVDLRLTAWGLPSAEADERLDAAAARLEEVLGPLAYARGDRDLADVLLTGLREREWTLAVAESCTGGLVGQRITSVPGSSAVFLGGVLAYADRVKQDQLGVSGDLLRLHGAVSIQVAEAMVQGVVERLGARVGIAVTGIAGPDGGSPEKPVGTVCFGWSVDGALTSERHVFPGGREAVRGRAAQYALHRALRLIQAFGVV